MKKHISLVCSMLLLLSMLLSVFSLGVFAVEKTLSTDKTEYTEGEAIMVTATGENKDWVAIYRSGEVPGGGVDSIYWYYVTDAGSGATKNIFDGTPNGSRSDYADIPAGNYTVYLLENDGYNVLAKVDITVVANPDAPEVPELVKSVKTDSNVYVEGEPIYVTATGDKKDWVGIYPKDWVSDSDERVNARSIFYYYVALEGHASGTAFQINNVKDEKAYPNPDADMEEWLSLPEGTYTLCLCENDDYKILDRVDITIKASADVNGYVQTRTGKDGSEDMRVLAEVKIASLEKYGKATLTVTFKTADGDVTYTKADITDAYTSVKANGESKKAREGYAFIGVVIVGIEDATSVSANITFDGGDAIELGSATLG